MCERGYQIVGVYPFVNGSAQYLGKVDIADAMRLAIAHLQVLGVSV